MKKRNTSKIASLVLCGALMAGFVLSPATASAADKTITGTGKLQAGAGGTKTATVDAGVGEMDQQPVTIPIKAQTLGAEIVYKLVVSYGAMEFKFSYGKTWDPSTHTYAPGNAGWDSTKLDGVNNKITITNHSNFPITATYSVDDLTSAFHESTPGASSPVRGCFADANSSFEGAANIAKLNDGTHTASSTASWTLEMDTSALSTGDTYYQYGSNGITKDMFFALCGKPDKVIETAAEVGNINITLAPATGVVERTKS